MKKDDTCYYMSITKEENSAFVVHANQNNQTDPQQKEGEVSAQESLIIEKLLLLFRSSAKESSNMFCGRAFAIVKAACRA